MQDQARQLHIGLSLTATWLKGRPHDPADVSWQGNPADYYVRLARLAEAARLDFVFKPDALFLLPMMAGGQLGNEGLDPTVLLAAIARETEHIGLVTTASTTFNPPYVVARQLQTLHAISGGRAGWNIVTSIDGAENFGDAPMPSADERYQKAAEFTLVVRDLWQSYPYAAQVSGMGVAPIAHRGHHFSVRGPLSVAMPPAGPMPLFQAGASPTGRDFAASLADATFAATPEMAAGVELRGDLRRRAEAHGRNADAVRVLPGLYFFLAPTREEAWDMHRQAHAHMTPERRHKSVQSILGLDVSNLPPETRINSAMLPDSAEPVRSRTHAELLRRFIAAREPSVGELLARPEVVGSAHWVSVGTVEDVVDDIVAWFEAGAMDGFIALPGGSYQSVMLFFEQVVPRLAALGLFRKAYSGSTLREHLRMGPA